MPSRTRTEHACLIDASRSARAHSERHLTAMADDRREQLERDWADNSFDGGYAFTANWTDDEKQQASRRWNGEV